MTKTDELNDTQIDAVAGGATAYRLQTVSPDATIVTHSMSLSPQPAPLARQVTTTVSH